MNPRTILFLSLLAFLLTCTTCNTEQKKNQPPTDADRQRIEKEYQQNLDKLHELTSGTKETLDRKRAPKPTASPKK